MCVVLCLGCACVWAGGRAVGGQLEIQEWLLVTGVQGERLSACLLATGKSPRSGPVAGSQPPSVAEALWQSHDSPREGGSWRPPQSVTVPWGRSRCATTGRLPGSQVCGHGLSHQGSVCGLADHPEGFKTAATGRGMSSRSPRESLSSL